MNRDQVAQQRLDMAEKLSPQVVMCKEVPGFIKSDKPFARELLTPGTKEMYNCCEWQYSIILCPGSTFEDVLNTRGMKMLRRAREMVKANQFNDTIYEYHTLFEASGLWTADQQSQYHSGKITASLCSLNNICVSGTSGKEHDAKKNVISTSACVFINEQEGWCYTQSGSLYKINKNKMNL